MIHYVKRETVNRDVINRPATQSNAPAHITFYILHIIWTQYTAVYLAFCVFYYCSSQLAELLISIEIEDSQGFTVVSIED